MPVSAIYVALIAAIMLVLSARVIRMRRAAGQSLGAGDNKILERRIRAHGNLAEYAPIGLIGLMVLEFSAMPAAVLHGLGIMLVAGRGLHAWALSLPEGSPFGRTGGMALTLSMIGISAVLCVWVFLTGGAS